MTRQNPWPWAIGSVFAVVVTLNMFYLRLALKTSSGSMEQESPYAKSQEFQNDINAEQALRRRNGQVTVRARGNSIFFRIEGARPSRVKLRALRTQSRGDDVTKELSRDPDGSFVLSPGLAPGMWFLRLDFEEGGENFLWRSTESF